MFQQGIIGFYRIPKSADPNKVYAIGSGGRPIVDPADLMKATGAKTIAEAWRLANVQDVSPEEAYAKGIRGVGINPQSQTNTPINATGNVTEASNPVAQAINQLNSLNDPNATVMARVLQVAQGQLDKLVTQGQTINPNVEITPEQSASFLAQAQKEIDPYYASQMAMARQSLLQFAGYSADQITAQETQWEKEYGRNVRQIGENAAESGFAQSGSRQLNEQNLAQNTQYQIDNARKAAQYNAQQSAQQYAQNWGTGNLPQINITQAPRVMSGQPNFVKGASQSPFYSLSDSTYQGLIGSEEYNKQVVEKTRASELESAFRTNQELNTRKLTL